MKTKYYIIIITSLIIHSCGQLKSVSKSDGDGVIDSNDYPAELSIVNYDLFDEINNDLVLLSNDTLNITEGKEVELKEEMIDLFSPDKFNCNCDEKLKRRIKKFKEKGFLPEVIEFEISMNPIGNLIDEQGANALVHSFKIEKSDGSFSKPLLANSSPTLNNFNELVYLETRTGVFNSFSYSLDCTGYLSEVIRAGIGAGNYNLKISADGASSSNKSLIVIKGVIYSPLYQAFKNEGTFKDNDTMRLKILKSIIHKIPSSISDLNKIRLNANYKVIVASNTGDSSFNGEAKLNASGNNNFLIGNFGFQLSAGGKIGRTSNFSRYKTYILEENIGTLEDDVLFPIKLIRDEIDSIESRLRTGNN